MIFEKKNKYSRESSDTDAMQYVKMASHGDELAFSKLVELYEKDVYNTALFILKSREDALDVSQEVFLNFWRTLKGFRGDCSVKSFLIRLTRNASYDLLRKQQYRRTSSLVIDDDGEEKTLDVADTTEENDPVKSYLRKERIELVRKAVSMLEYDQKEMIVMRDMNCMSYSDIAKALNIAEGTVKSRISRARSSLKKILIELGYE